MGSNEITVELNPQSIGQIVALSNASWLQDVDIIIDGVLIASFEGQGEASPMQLSTGGTALPIATQAAPQTCTLRFTYNKGIAWMPATVNSQNQVSDNGVTKITVTTEDGLDNDGNDTVVLIYFFSEDNSPLPNSDAVAVEDQVISSAAPAVGSAIGAPQRSLELHAKTYYNDPNLQGGDEHYVTLAFDQARPGPNASQIIPRTCNSLGWNFTSVDCIWTPGIVFNDVLLNVTAKRCSHPGMENATLQLVASTWCVGNQPDTWSPDWTGKLIGCQYLLTRVTV